MPTMRKPKVLTIAGSDSGGGAGIQADLKTFEALGCYGMSAITAVTAQNTLGVTSAVGLSATLVGEQLCAVLEDLGADAIKIGMVYNVAIIESVSRVLKQFELPPIVIDPVMVAKGGAPLLQPDAIAAFVELLLPLATIVTPNLPEAQVIVGSEVHNTEQMEQAALILSKTVPSVLIKGGHLESQTVSPDLFVDEEGTLNWIEYPRIDTPNTHGTGCTYSAAIASHLSHGELSIFESVCAAREYLQRAIESGARYQFGKGHGPVNHAWKTEGKMK